MNAEMKKHMSLFGSIVEVNAMMVKDLNVEYKGKTYERGWSSKPVVTRPAIVTGVGYCSFGAREPGGNYGGSYEEPPEYYPPSFSCQAKKLVLKCRWWLTEKEFLVDYDSLTMDESDDVKGKGWAKRVGFMPSDLKEKRDYSAWWTIHPSVMGHSAKDVMRNHKSWSVLSKEYERDSKGRFC